MLVKFTDTKGVDTWVNAAHVKGLREKRGVTEIFVTINPTWGQNSIKVRQPAAEIAELLNAAMPGFFFPPDDDSGGGSAATNAAILAG